MNEKQITPFEITMLTVMLQRKIVALDLETNNEDLPVQLFPIKQKLEECLAYLDMTQQVNCACCGLVINRSDGTADQWGEIFCKNCAVYLYSDE